MGSSSLTRDWTPASCTGVLATGSPGKSPSGFSIWQVRLAFQLISVLFSPVISISTMNPRAWGTLENSPFRCLYLLAAGGKRGWGKKRGANTSILKLCKDVCHICTTKVQFKKKILVYFSINLPAAAAPTLNRNLNGCSLFTRRQAKWDYLKVKCSGQITISRYIQTIFMLTHLIKLYLYVRFLAAGNSFW